MKNSWTQVAALAMTAVVLSAATGIEALAAPAHVKKEQGTFVKPVKPAPFRPASHAAPAIPHEEPSVAASPNAGFASTSAFSAATPTVVTPLAQTLSGPVTLSYGGSSPAFTLTQSGTGKGLSAAVANAGSGSSALYGQTVGSGAGLTGYNLGTGGPGGKFEVTNAHSAQAGAFASTNGTGSGLLATITNTSSSSAAVYGQSLASTDGYGVEGDGNVVGVEGFVPSTTTASETAAVYGLSFATSGTATNNWAVLGANDGNGIGVGAQAQGGYGLSASSDSNYAVYAVSTSGSAIYAESDSTSNSAYGVYATVQSGNAIQGVATAEDGYGVYGESTNGIGVVAIDHGSGPGIYTSSDSGAGIQAFSGTGNAGEFYGPVSVTGAVTAASYLLNSDRNLKSDIRQIDGKDVLDQLSQLPISSWHYTNDPDKRHVGPMAQDFHAAFGLNGADDTHISTVDIAGVSLAAIQELNRQMQAKDAQMQTKDAEIADLQAKVAKLTAQAAALSAQAEVQTKAVADIEERFAARVTALEQGVALTQSVSLKLAAKQRVD